MPAPSPGAGLPCLVHVLMPGLSFSPVPSEGINVGGRDAFGLMIEICCSEPTAEKPHLETEDARLGEILLAECLLCCQD